MRQFNWVHFWWLRIPLGFWTWIGCMQVELTVWVNVCMYVYFTKYIHPPAYYSSLAVLGREFVNVALFPTARESLWTEGKTTGIYYKEKLTSGRSSLCVEARVNYLTSDYTFIHGESCFPFHLNLRYLGVLHELANLTRGSRMRIILVSPETRVCTWKSTYLHQKGSSSILNIIETKFAANPDSDENWRFFYKMMKIDWIPILAFSS